jgi:hypothetical protein
MTFAMRICCGLATLLIGAAASASPGRLRPSSDFAGFASSARRSQAIFEEAGKVFLHPRCLNCHPAKNMPTQEMTMVPHRPAIVAGSSGHGAPGLACRTCHQAINMPVVGETLMSIPGNPKWALAPHAFAWQNRSLGQVCRQVKDSRRNGHRSLAAIQEHVAHDPLVGWAWHPGAGREPAPGTQKAFGTLIAAWIASGAVCPP